MSYRDDEIVLRYKIIDGKFIKGSTMQELKNGSEIGYQRNLPLQIRTD